MTDDPRVEAVIQAGAKIPINIGGLEREAVKFIAMLDALRAVEAQPVPPPEGEGLLPCPFCGHAAHRPTMAEGDFSVDCTVCGASTYLRDNQMAADAQWNARAPDPRAEKAEARVKELEHKIELAEAISYDAKEDRDSFKAERDEARAVLAAVGTTPPRRFPPRPGP